MILEIIINYKHINYLPLSRSLLLYLCLFSSFGLKYEVINLQ